MPDLAHLIHIHHFAILSSPPPSSPRLSRIGCCQLLRVAKLSPRISMPWASSSISEAGCQLISCSRQLSTPPRAAHDDRLWSAILAPRSPAHPIHPPPKSHPHDVAHNPISDISYSAAETQLTTSPPCSLQLDRLSSAVSTSQAAHPATHPLHSPHTLRSAHRHDPPLLTFPPPSSLLHPTLPTPTTTEIRMKETSEGRTSAQVCTSAHRYRCTGDWTPTVPCAPLTLTPAPASVLTPPLLRTPSLLTIICAPVCIPYDVFRLPLCSLPRILTTIT